MTIRIWTDGTTRALNIAVNGGPAKHYENASDALSELCALLGLTEGEERALHGSSRRKTPRSEWAAKTSRN